jgi:hypothetical protein
MNIPGVPTGMQLTEGLFSSRSSGRSVA